MRSRSRTVRLPFIVDDLLQKICKESGYSDMSGCILAACILLIHNWRRSQWITEVVNSGPKHQDIFLEKMFTFPMNMPDMLEALKKIEPPKRKPQ